MSKSTITEANISFARSMFGIFLLIVGVLCFCAYLGEKENDVSDITCTIVADGKAYKGIEYKDIKMIGNRPMSFFYDHEKVIVKQFDMNCSK